MPDAMQDDLMVAQSKTGRMQSAAGEYELWKHSYLPALFGKVCSIGRCILGFFKGRDLHDLVAKNVNQCNWVTVAHNVASVG